MNSQKQRKQWAAGAASQPVPPSGGQQKPTARKEEGQGKPMIGLKFGRLLVLSQDGRDKYSNVICDCICDCGNKHSLRAAALRSGKTVSCGCLRDEVAKTFNVKHSGKLNRKPSLTYHSWQSMKSRCLNKNDPGYKRYGGRGIQICERWMKFENFLADMGERPPGTSIDRINNDGNYEPGNCRWATKKEQLNNTRSNRRITFDGVTLNVTQWTKKLGFKRGIIDGRLKLGWSIEKTMTTPMKIYAPARKKDN